MSDSDGDEKPMKQDVLERATAHLASLPPHLRGRYSAHLILDLANEIDRLRLKCWQRLRLQDAVIRSGTVAALTDAEREAIKWCIFQQATPQRTAVTLRNLLERLDVPNPLPIETSAEVSSRPKSDRIYVSGQDSND
jgi:hypothetical protein